MQTSRTALTLAALAALVTLGTACGSDAASDSVVDTSDPVQSGPRAPDTDDARVDPEEEIAPVGDDLPAQPDGADAAALAGVLPPVEVPAEVVPVPLARAPIDDDRRAPEATLRPAAEPTIPRWTGRE